MARLNADGSLDLSFNPGAGGNGAVFTLALQADGKSVLGGDFTTFDNVTRNRITRLNADGSVDTTINFGLGASGFIGAVAIQSDRKIVMGGGFTGFNGVFRNHLARLHGGSMAGVGQIEFSSAFFTVDESATNAVIIVRRTGGTSGTVSVDVDTTAGSAQSLLDYTDQSLAVIFPPGETVLGFHVPILNDSLVEGDGRSTSP